MYRRKKYFEIPFRNLSLRGSEATEAILKKRLLRPFGARNDTNLDSNVKKNVYIIAGPNGSSKTTFAKRRRKKYMTLQDKAWAAMKKAIRQVVERHKKTGRSLAVWQNGKVVRISPNSV